MMIDRRGGSVPDPLPVATTELDWAEQARHDGWHLAGGIWQHDDRPDAYDDGDWVYLGDGAWEDSQLAALTPDERRTTLERYTSLRADVADIARQEVTER
jgi:hypothetical protein